MTMNRKVLWVIIVIVAILLGFLGWRFLKGDTPASIVMPGQKIGRVDLKKAMQIHPSYNAYIALEKEITDLENEYSLDREEKGRLVASQIASMEQPPTIDQGFIDSLNDELKAKIQAKEDELNGKLSKKQQELVKELSKELESSNREADLRIVNLQLELRSNIHPVIISQDQEALYQEKRKKKEEELDALLAKRGGLIDGNGRDIKARLEKAMKPYIEASEKELALYAKTVNDSLSQRLEERQKSLINSSQEIGLIELADQAEWNQKWQQRLEDKQAELESMKDAILDDIRTRVSVIAKDKQIDLVITDEVANVNAIDITDAVIASY